MYNVAQLIPWQRALDVVRGPLGYVYPADKQRAEDVLVAVNHAVWIESIDLFDVAASVDIGSDGSFWSPPGFGAMKAVNVDGHPEPIRGRFHEFHPNGPGNWASVQTSQLGIFAAMDSSVKAAWFTVGVLAVDVEDQDFAVVVEGVDVAGNLIDSFADTPKGVVKTPGVVVRPQAEMVHVSDRKWKSIRSIRKKASYGPVQVYVFPEGDLQRGVLVADVPSYYGKDTPSVYHKHKLGVCPDTCRGWPCVYGKFGLLEPTGPGPVVLASSPSTLIPAALTARATLQLDSTDPRVKRELLRDAASEIVRSLRAANNDSQETPEMFIYEPTNFRIP